MSMVVHLQAFSGTELDARAEIQAMGWYPYASDVAAEHNESHFHPFDSIVFIVDGVLRFHDVVTSEFHVCPPGTRIDDIGENVHREDHEGYRAIVAFAEDPAVLFASATKQETSE
ncbi:MAG: hypothetical protein F2681_08140 [Actinobacteria bacterium]|uniref:Unannotated protein n=1 Tax=freshwater metagenome TaxID=449393 RepID=A0A6J6A8T5_9ZZZZ|nr:hypothetical protein [Actinomycetota bacterium]MSW77751.1 hypothetical protein [Actinomycetota bacterium]MSX55258.1 hypothetical protein [Actinomycetota bacterium]MSX92829.1 hypothetical protein [Actinomycetota bacterium]MSZ83096.1 hypothetical protein [Actinomycetota bacterium]